jgi:hypothetical protein
MVLMIDENIVATARHTQHAVAGGHGEWITSTHRTPLPSGQGGCSV